MAIKMICGDIIFQQTNGILCSIIWAISKKQCIGFENSINCVVIVPNVIWQVSIYTCIVDYYRQYGTAIQWCRGEHRIRWIIDKYVLCDSVFAIIVVARKKRNSKIT